MRVEPAGPDQAPLVHDIMRRSFAEYQGLLHPPSGALTDTLEKVAQGIREGGAVLVWEGDEPLASAQFRLQPDHLYVGRVAVLPEYRCRGIARTIMRWVEERAMHDGRCTVRLGVRMSLPQNREVYERLGYRLVDVQQHPRGPEKIGWMEKKLAADLLKL